MAHPSPPTAAFLTQKCNLPTRTIKFEIWDTAGQERFASLAPMYYRNAQAALVVYDITKASSLTKAQHWVAELQRQASPGIVIALVGNKADLVEADSGVSDPEESTPEPPSEAAEGGAGAEGAAGAEGEEGAEGGDEAAPPAPEAAEDDDEDSDARKVATKTAKSYADEEGLLFFETSAKTGQNVPEVFTAIANAIPETSLKGPRGVGQSNIRGQDDSGRVNLTNARDAQGAKEGCAC